MNGIMEVEQYKDGRTGQTGEMGNCQHTIHCNNRNSTNLKYGDLVLREGVTVTLGPCSFQRQSHITFLLVMFGARFPARHGILQI